MHWRGANVARTGKNKIKMSEMSSELGFTFDLFCFPMQAYANSQRGGDRIVKHREAYHAAVHGVTKSWT